MITFKTSYKNIVSVQVDVIVNSVGIDGGTNGLICKSILEACHDYFPNLEDTIIHENKKYGEYFITRTSNDNTPNPNVAAKCIMHYVTPRGDQGFPEENLAEGIIFLIEEAIKKGYKSLGLPKIGTNYNKVTKDTFQKAIKKVQEHFENDKMTFYKTLFLVEKILFLSNQTAPEAVFPIFLPSLVVRSLNVKPKESE